MIEFSRGSFGEIVDKTQIMVAGDLAKLKALSDPEHGVVRVDYLLLPDRLGAASFHITNLATRNYGAAEYQGVIREMMPAMLDIRDPLDIKNKVE